MNCHICGAESQEFFRKKILSRYEVPYFKCPNCDFIQTATPFWLEEAYHSSINMNDTGLAARNFRLTEILSPILFWFFRRDGLFLDYGAGYELLLMRDKGFNFVWSDQYSKTLFAQGFEASPGEKYEVVTAMEVFEHIESPMDLLKQLMEQTDNLIISTNLTDNIPDSKLPEWDYLCPEHGPHLSFYSLKAFHYIAATLGLNIYYGGRGLIVLCRKRRSRLLNFVLSLRHRYLLLLFELVKTRMSSKTISDHQIMTEKL